MEKNTEKGKMNHEKNQYFAYFWYLEEFDCRCNDRKRNSKVMTERKKR